VTVGISGLRNSAGVLSGGTLSRQGGPSRPLPWALAILVIAPLTLLFMVGAKPVPAYDAMGFLVWGHQGLHWNLNLNGAPSWKPLVFVATLPFALVGHRGEQWLWIFTADAGGLAAAALAGRLAYRLSPVVRGRNWARVVGALCAAYGVASMVGYARLLLIANADPLTIALALCAIDCHLSRRYRAAFVLLCLTAFSRPEAWPFMIVYAAWLWREDRSNLWLAVSGVFVTLLIWLVVPALTSHSWMSSSDFALGQATAIHGDKFTGVFERLRTLTGVPAQIAVLCSVALAFVRRDLPVLWLTGLAVLWALVEIAFALHGYSAVQRYLIEPAAVLCVVAGVGIGYALSRTSGPGRWIGPLAFVVLVAGLIPYTHDTAVTDHGLVSEAHSNSRLIGNLARVVAAEGGPGAIRACGQPASSLTYQSSVAWEVGVNVGTVKYGVRKAMRSGQAVVSFRAKGEGWVVRVAHTTAACKRLNGQFYG
jgi:hypothetical protein